jgi:ketosteroid isomerase-like protein
VSERADRLRAAVAAVARGDIEPVAGMAADDCVVHEWEAFPGAEVFHGPDGMRSIYRKFTEVMPDWHFEMGEQEEHGDVVLSQVTARGHGRESGVDVGLALVAENRFRGEQITLLRFHADWDAARAAATAPE